MINRREFVGSSFSAAMQVAMSNPKIRAGHEAAIAALKPSQKELERGLKLHQNSLVIESYGFSPRSAIDGDLFRKTIESGANNLELEDLFEEMIMTRCATNAAEKSEYLEAWQASGVTCILQNAGEEGQDPMRLMKRLARFTFTTDVLRDSVSRAAFPEDIPNSKKQKRHCLYFSGNGVPLEQQWNSVQEELGYIRIFFQLGIRMMHLTYNRRNMLGDGCAEPANAGLSDLGRAAIREMNDTGVIVDVAHSGWRTSLEAAKVSTKPMVASHSGAAEVNRHIRCKPDDVIRAIADTGGYVGICCIPSFLGRTGDLVAMMDHIEYIVKKFGADHVAIGTDIAYFSRFAEAEYRKAGRRPKSRNRFESFWPEGALSAKPDHPSLVWTNWPMFTVGMAQRGISDTDIQKILGGNVMRVATSVFPKSILRPNSG